MVNLLSKVVGQEIAERAIRMTKKLFEENVEVVSLSLNQEERLLLNQCVNFFGDDAWHAVGANIRHSSDSRAHCTSVS